MAESRQQEIAKLRAGLRTTFASRSTLSYESRVRVLKKFRQVFQQFESQIVQALHKDLARCETMAQFGDVVMINSNVNHSLQSLRSWMKNEDRDIPAAMAPGRTYLKNDPYGLCLVVGAWNFPFTTTLVPVISAISAGNCVCVKPSEISPESSRVMKNIIDAMKEPSVQCIEGGTDVIVPLLEQRWDVIVFTGSPEKGKLVAKAAAEHLTPTVLELGGKNPVIVDADADMKLACQRIVQGRHLNSGQLCISPEIALVHESRLESFLETYQKTVTEFFGENPKNSPDLGRIVNDLHFQRISRLLEDHGGRVVVGGDTDPAQKYIAPTLILNPRVDSAVAKEEIFGPILLAYSFQNREEVVQFVNEREKPLALYYFGKKKSNADFFVDTTSSGGFVWNDTAMHYGCSDISFGGVGNSGTSKIMGHMGFLALSHRKGVLEATTVNPPIRYPPFAGGRGKTFVSVMTKFGFSTNNMTRGLKRLVLLGVAIYAVRAGYFDSLIQPVQRIISSQISRFTS